MGVLSVMRRSNVRRSRVLVFRRRSSYRKKARKKGALSGALRLQTSGVRNLDQSSVAALFLILLHCFVALAMDREGVRRLGKYGQADIRTSDFVFAVSDGMGGAKAGDFASQVAVDKITRLLPKSFRSAASGIQIGFQDLLDQLFHEIHAELTQMSNSYEELKGMGATLSLCWVRPDWVCY